MSDAKRLIKLGREAVLSQLLKKPFEVPQDIKNEFRGKVGVFTTILTYPDENLRGCVGIPYPIYPLWEAVVRSSLDASFRDPRFKPLTLEEFDKVLWEISILGPLEEIPKEGLPDEIVIGRDGLVLEKGNIRALLLPQVPVELSWDRETFLAKLCEKAGLRSNCWQSEDAKVYRFSARIFKETDPLGDVKEVVLKAWT